MAIKPGGKLWQAAPAVAWRTKDRFGLLTSTICEVTPSETPALKLTDVDWEKGP
jgi:hypothetical protein